MHIQTCDSFCHITACLVAGVSHCTLRVDKVLLVDPNNDCISELGFKQSPFQADTTPSTRLKPFQLYHSYLIIAGNNIKDINACKDKGII